MTVSKFADAEHPQLIPLDIDYAALYSADCDHPAAEEFPGYPSRWDKDHRHWITFGGARQCLIADYEPGTEVYHDPHRLRTWSASRHAIKLRAVTYCDMSDVRSAQELQAGLPQLWWLGTKGLPVLTPAELAARLRDQFGTIVAPQQIWAQQIIGDTYDWSALFRAW